MQRKNRNLQNPGLRKFRKTQSHLVMMMAKRRMAMKMKMKRRQSVKVDLKPKLSLSQTRKRKLRRVKSMNRFAKNQRVSLGTKEGPPKNRKGDTEEQEFIKVQDKEEDEKTKKPRRNQRMRNFQKGLGCAGCAGCAVHTSMPSTWRSMGSQRKQGRKHERFRSKSYRWQLLTLTP